MEFVKEGRERDGISGEWAVGNMNGRWTANKERRVHPLGYSTTLSNVILGWRVSLGKIFDLQIRIRWEICQWNRNPIRIFTFQIYYLYLSTWRKYRLDRWNLSLYYLGENCGCSCLTNVYFKIGNIRKIWKTLEVKCNRLRNIAARSRKNIYKLSIEGKNT